MRQNERNPVMAGNPWIEKRAGSRTPDATDNQSGAPVKSGVNNRRGT
jgi:hypothetical protein